MLGLGHVMVVKGQCSESATEANVSIHGAAQKEWAGAKLWCEIKFLCSVVVDVGGHLNG